MSSEDESITLAPAQHDKLGVMHCGVTREGFIAVAGDTANIEDGQQLKFERVKVAVTRKGSEYTFTRYH